MREHDELAEEDEGQRDDAVAAGARVLHDSQHVVPGPAAARFGIVGAEQLGHLAARILDHLDALDVIGVLEPDLPARRQAVVFGRRRLPEVLPLDPQLARERQPPRAGVRVFGVVDGLELLDRIMPGMSSRVRLHDKPYPIFEEYGVQAELDKALAIVGEGLRATVEMVCIPRAEMPPKPASRLTADVPP